MSISADTTIKENIAVIQKAIRSAAEKYGRDPDSVKLVAVSKTKPSGDIQAAIKAGADIFGENYIQEAKCKIETLSEFPVSWHFIGHLQSNKAKTAVALFDLIHTVDSMKLAQEINKHAEHINKCQKILIQVNIAKEAAKSGIAKENVLSLIENISKLDHISIRGLMTMPPYSIDPEKARLYFRSLSSLAKEIKQAGIPKAFMAELSMGMTRDFQIAIEEGATLVRIGTAIFGKRK